MNQERIFEQHVAAATNRAYFLGGVLGVVAGFVAAALLWSPFL